MNIKELTVGAIVASLYVVITYLCAPLAYGGIQFRISEALVLICFYNKKYVIPMTIGCILANILSPFGIIDIIIGSTATLLAAFAITKCKNIYLASLMPVISSIIIGFELALINFDTNAFAFSNFNFAAFALFTAQVAAGQFVCVSILGVILWKSLERNYKFMELIESQRELKGE